MYNVPAIICIYSLFIPVFPSSLPFSHLSLFPSLPSSSSPQMVVSNLSQYHDQLVSGVPLFTVETLLSAPEIVLHPHANELVKMLMAAMREVVER